MTKNLDKKKVNILLVIKDQEFYQELLNDKSTNNFVIHYAQDTKTALEYLKMGQNHFHCVFVNPTMSNEAEVSVLEGCHGERAGVPVYLILKGVQELGQDLNVQEAGFQGTITNKNELIAVTRVIEQNMGQFDSEAAIRMAKETPDPEEGEEGDLLVPINAANFLSGSVSFFDLFVRLRQGKYVKILNARDTFDVERLEYYRTKGLTHFWIKKETQKMYIDFCSKLATKIINTKGINNSVKINMTLNQGQEVIGFLSRNGLDESSLSFATAYSENVTLLIKNIAKDNKAINALLKNVAAFEHAAGTAMICGLMARQAQLDSAQSVNILGLAATLHDVGLYKEKSIYENDPENRVCQEEIDIELELENTKISQSRRKELLKTYHERPQKGVEICQSIKNIDPDVIQIIAHHHERTDGSGFPNKISGAAINPLAQILSITDEFSKLIRKVYLGKAPRENLASFSTKLNGYSLKHIKIWESIFLKSK
jgi:HD-GYP domain-containing protein (c-di-GMP phosphodiesterase class II)